MSTTPANFIHGNVKQVLSGDCLVLQRPARGGPPAEKIVALSGITCPRIARRPPANAERFQSEARDEPWAWEAREFTRKRCIGRDVTFVVENVANSGREYGQVYLGPDTSSDCLSDLLLAEGYAEVRRSGPQTETSQRLAAQEEEAKNAGKGKWEQGVQSAAHVRDIVWNIESLTQFVQQYQGRELPAIIEHIRDGSTMRAFLIIDGTYYNVMLMISGVKAPAIRLEGDKQIPETYALEARYFVERRLLQREVRIIPETFSTNNLVGSVVHPNGNIAELLLKEGFARCVDWNMGVVTGGAEKLRSAERLAKQNKLRLWKDFTGDVSGNSSAQKVTFLGKVTEVGNGDNVSVKCQDGTVRKFFLASVRPPRPAVTDTDAAPTPGKTRPRPLYDVPYVYEAREFLRKKLVGKKVSVRVDYNQPKNEGYEERVCCTVMMGELNVAEALVSKGLGTVIRYRATDDKRSSAYDALLAAEAVAQKKAVGVHSKKEPPSHRVADITGDATKSKQFLPFLKRGGKLQAVVEYVAGGSRLRVFIHSDTCLITFLCAGIECPRSPRRLPSGQDDPGDPFGSDALVFTRDICMQREVEVELESVDKGGNFIGWMWVEGTNLSVSLVEHGLAKVHFSAERSSHYAALCRAEDKARQERLNLWSIEVSESADSGHDTGVSGESVHPAHPNGLDEEKDSKSTNADKRLQKSDRKTQYKKGYVVSMSSEGLRFFVQFLDAEVTLRRIRETLTSELGLSSFVPGAYQPRKGEICAAMFADGEWYRARVEGVNRNTGHVSVFYIDFGNAEVITDAANRMASLPSSLSNIPAQAAGFRLAGVTLPTDEDDAKIAMEAFQAEAMRDMIAVNVEYESDGQKMASVVLPDASENSDKADPKMPLDIAEKLLEDGLVFIDPALMKSRDAARMRTLLKRYQTMEEKAMKNRRNIWRYGDFRGEETL